MLMWRNFTARRTIKLVLPAEATPLEAGQLTGVDNNKAARRPRSSVKLTWPAGRPARWAATADGRTERQTGRTFWQAKYEAEREKKFNFAPLWPPRGGRKLNLLVRVASLGVVRAAKLDWGQWSCRNLLYFSLISFRCGCRSSLWSSRQAAQPADHKVLSAPLCWPARQR